METHTCTGQFPHKGSWQRVWGYSAPSLLDQADHPMQNDVQRFPLFAGAMLAALGVGLGAFGAHGLRNLLDATALTWWETAVQYQMWHALGLVALGASRQPQCQRPAVLLTAGTVIFAGTLYMMALGAPRWLGAVTPIGGSLMILGWLLLAWRVLHGQQSPGH